MSPAADIVNSTGTRAIRITRPLPVEVEAPGLVRTARMVFRPLRESDRAEFLRVVQSSRAHLARWSELHRPCESDRAMFDRQVAMCGEGDARGTAWRRAAFLDDGRLAGCFNLNSIDRGLSFEADANWWVSAECSGRGLGTEGVSALLEHALTDLPRGLGLNLIRASIAPENLPCRKLAQRVGLLPTAERVWLAVGGRWEKHDVFERRLQLAV
ncbi:hypothetical protein PHYC_02539 [Phycisphaerales bacterium]|nr:hypothetical protein PHYC_02539 [Phycisphaerales bacterium]